MAQTPDYSKMTVAQLRAVARRKKIAVKSGASKGDLVKAIKKVTPKTATKKKSKPTAKTAKRKTQAARAKSPAAKKVKGKAKTSRGKISGTGKAKAKSAAKKVKPKTKAASKTKKTAGKKAPSKKTARTAPAKSRRPSVAVKKKAKKTSTPKRAASKPKASSPKKAAPSAPRPRMAASALPAGYGDHRLVAMARDPNWAYVYWDLDPKRVRDLQPRPGQGRWILRVYSTPLHPVEHTGSFFDVDINVKDGGYYLDLSRPGARFTIEIGVVDASGRFHATAKSNPVILPLDHPAGPGASPKGADFFYGGSAMPGSSETVPIPEALTSPGGTGLFKKPPPSGSR